MNLGLICDLSNHYENHVLNSYVYTHAAHVPTTLLSRILKY